MSAAAPAFVPLQAGARLQALDVTRGVALLGILLMNLEGFFGPPVAAATGLDLSLQGADRWVDAGIYLLVQGKFYLVFSLLFGMGFAVMAARAQAAGRAFGAFYLRRSLGLLGIGLAHALLLWSGDILVPYALLSLLLLVVAPRVSGNALLGLAAAAFAVMPLLLVLAGAIGSVQAASPQADGPWQQSVAQAMHDYQATLAAQRAAYAHGSWWQASMQRAHDLGETLAWLPLFSLPILAMFLLGAWAVRSGVVDHPQAHARLYAALRRVGLPVGLVLMLASFLLSPQILMLAPDMREGAAAALGMLAAGLMCLGYFAWIVQGLASPGWARRLAWLAPAGRMALSNYLAQSLVCTTLAYGYGVGLFERVPRSAQLVLALALFAVQVLASRWWLARFRFGPVEWLWRSLTYLRPQPMRVADTAGA